MFGKQNLFYKYLLSYFIIFLIPYLTISIIFYQMSVSSLQKEITQSNLSKLEQIKDLTDSRMEELKNIATRISSDHRLTSFKVRQSYSNIEAIQELGKYHVNSAIIDGLYLFYNNADFIYSSKGSSSIDTVTTYDYKIIEKEREKFEELLYTSSLPIVHPLNLISNNENEERKVIAFFYPLPINSSKPYGKVLFFVREETLTNMIHHILSDFEGNIFVINRDKEILSSIHEGKELKSEIVYDLSNQEFNVVNKKINNEKYSLVKVHSDLSGWTFMTAMPTVQFYSKLSSLKKLIITLFLIIAILGFCLAYLLSLKQYRPIKNLARHMKSNDEAGFVKGQHKDELEIIRDSIDLMVYNSQKLERRVIEQKPFVRAQILLEMLKGNTKDGINGISKEGYLLFNGTHFFVMLISYNESSKGLSFYEREGLIGSLSHVAYSGCVGYGFELFRENVIALIVSIDEERYSPNYEREHFIYHVEDLISHIGDNISKIGVGNVHHGVKHVKRSYIEALASIEYNLVNNSSSIVFFDDITIKMERQIWYPTEYQVKFTQSLKQGDFQLAKENLDAIFQYFQNEKVSISIVKCMCFDISNTVLKYLAELEMIHKAQNINDIVNFHSLEQLKTSLIILIQMACEEVDSRKESNNIQLRDEILDYIQSEYKSNHLTLDLLATSFNLSTSYMSRFFKEQVGFTFTQYVWELRLKEFKRLLIVTDLPIREIVQDIGYVDVANFTRKFRKEEGLTPGQYRQSLKLGDVNM